MWNGYGEGFQPAALELQNYIPPNREQSKNHLVHSTPPYVFFNYPDESAHHFHHYPENISRNQWHFTAWPKMKVIPDSVFQERYTEKQFYKDGDVGMPLVHQGSTNVNAPSGANYYASDLPEPITTDVHRVCPLLESQDTVNINIPVPVSITNSQSVAAASTSTHKATARKTSVPRKQKTKLKKEDSLSKRTRNEEKWARNIRKKARSKGESYVSVQGRTVPARSVKTVDCSKCKFNCSSLASDEQRQQLFKEYWDLETFKEKVDYIAGCVNEFAPLRPVSGRRAYSRRYTLKIDGKDERVCKEFFVNTFDISESTIVTYMAKKRKGPDAVADLRGKQTPSNKTPESTVRLIREHILSQTGLQGELARSPSEDVKNVKRLYHHYQTECEIDKVKPASISVYRKVYSDMHKDEKHTPVEIPPDVVLTQNKKTKQSTFVEKDDSIILPSLKEQNIISPIESSVSLDVSSNSRPPVAEVASSTNSISLPQTFQELDLRQYAYSTGDQHQPTNPFYNKKSSIKAHQSVSQQQVYHHHHHHTHQHTRRHQQPTPSQQHSCQGDLTTCSHDRGHVNIFPFVWDSNRLGSSCAATDYNLGYCPLPYSNQSHLIQPSSSPSSSSSSLFNYKVTSSSKVTSLPPASTSDTVLRNKPNQAPLGEASDCKSTLETSSTVKVKARKRSKSKKEPKKRIRNEDTWDRNVRKRLRFKGEAYISVKGKLVEARNVKDVDCSKCKFKCTSRINTQQQQKLNILYWSLDTYKKKIEFLNKYVQTYTPKRKMTGRREYSRKYVFDVDGNHERVCKDFFTATLHISESTIATALKKSRKGPDAVVDMRGKHKPVNKTTEETLQNIRELIIYLTGMRPHRANNSSRQGVQYTDVNRLYQVYRYDSDKKGKKTASLGIFRSVLVKEFCIKSSKFKNADSIESEREKDTLLPECTTDAPHNTASSSTDTWSGSIPQPSAVESGTVLLNEILPKSVTCGGTTFEDLNIPNL